MAETPSHFRGSYPLELFHFMCGDRIGQGIAREVYEFKPDPRYVIKFELGVKDFQNICEWELWREAPKGASRWLAPCIDISDHGMVLLQQRVMHLPSPPRMIPRWLEDAHADNWGTLDGRPVVVDYGRHGMIAHGFKTMKGLVKRKA